MNLPADELKKETKEHPSLPAKTVQQIVKDHMKKHGAKHTKMTIAKHYKSRLAKHSGIAQIPTDYTKRLDGNAKSMKPSKKVLVARHWKKMHGIKHGSFPSTRTARHSIGMTEFAMVDTAFLREGEFRTNGIPFKYPWEVIERDGKTFEGKEFDINHPDGAGSEYGLIDKIYSQVINGEKWLCAKVKVPETNFTQPFLERIQNGLIKFVSSTHTLFTNPDKNNRVVEKIQGLGLSVVKQPEVEGARILGVVRHAEKGVGMNA